MQHTRSTGQVAHILGLSEPQLADAVRRRKIDPPPLVVAGRRLWSRGDLNRAAEHFGVSLPSLDREDREEVGHGA